MLGALYSNTNTAYNTATGYAALRDNSGGTNNTANGASALYFNTTGSNNTANGSGAIGSNLTGIGNTANGVNALFHNTTGNQNTATGTSALFNNNASGNTATGCGALLSDTTGRNNTAIGPQALGNNTTGSYNIAVGDNAGGNLTTGNDNIDIGNAGVAGESGTMRIGNIRQTAAYIQGIYGQTVASGVGVIIDSTGHLGTVQSSARFKEGIKPMDKVSEAILALKPVTFRYKQALDPHATPQFGLIAEEVEKVNPDLVVRDADGRVNTVRYDAVNAMLLNEFLKEHRTVQEVKSTLAKQEANMTQQRRNFEVTIARQQKQIEALTEGLQKVSAQLEVSKSAPQTVQNNQ